MRIVIEIPKPVYKYVMQTGEINMLDTQQVANAIFDGTPLPKGHGRLIDADKFKEEIYVIDVYSEESVKQQISDAPIIIEADKAESEE